MSTRQQKKEEKQDPHYSGPEPSSSSDREIYDSEKTETEEEPVMEQLTEEQKELLKEKPAFSEQRANWERIKEE